MNEQCDRKWRIWSIEHSAWWGLNSHGYVPNAHNAGVYSTDEAVEICVGANSYRKANFLPNEAMVPVSTD